MTKSAAAALWPRTSYMLCTTPRSGSTLLCRMLCAAGGAGAPESLFNGTTLVAWARSFGVPATTPRAEVLPQIFAAARAEGMGGTDVFGLRQQWPRFWFLRDTLARMAPDARSDVDRLAAVFGPMRFIALTREDKLGQAISWLRAQETGLWHRAADGSELERLPVTRAGGYDAAAISAAMAGFHADDAGWQGWFDAEGVTPLRITYEALARDPHAALRRVLSFLDVDPDRAQGVPVPVRKLADAVSADWTARYRREAAL